MKKAHVLLLFLSVSVMAYAGIVSGLKIPPGQEFYLGNNYHRSYKASVENKGITKVEISTQMVEGKKMVVDTVFPGETKKYKLEKNQATVLRNLSKVMRANLLVKAKGDDNLSMYYEEWGREKDKVESEK